MATTTNFSWETPDDTDLVKDGAAAIRTLGNSIDTSFVDLKGGTTGQVLAKASGTDLDFSWVAQDDSNAIQNAIVDAKGDLIVATAADTPARLAVGTNGQVLTADSAEATGMKWATSSSGGYTLLSTTSLSAVTTTISSISQSYKHLMIVLRSIYTSGGDSLYFRANGDTGNNYSYSGSYQSYTSFSQYNTSTGNRLPILYAPETTTARRGNAVIWIYNYTLADYKFISSMGGSGVGSGNIGSTYLNCYHLNSSATDSITLNGNADTVYGTVYIYGVS